MNESTPWVLVTGGTRGIGKDLVFTLSRKYRVVFTYRQSGDEARAIVQRCAEQGFGVQAIQCDGADASAVERRAAELVQAMGAPHALINNAGVTRDTLFLNLDAQTWLDVIDNNLNAVFHWTRGLLPSMVEAGSGVVIMMSSVSGLKGNVGQTSYSATKSALLGLTRSLSLEVARFGVRVNAIAPGIIDTDMLQEMTEAARKAMFRSVPMKRAGTVEDVSSMVDYLIGEPGKYVTGQCFVIDGGLTA